MKLLVINGPNINMLGIREKSIYGSKNYKELQEYIKMIGKREAIKIDEFQSNHEGEIVDCIQKAYQVYDGIIINPAAYTHTSIAILDALKAVNIPTIEVHLSDVSEREAYRQISYVKEYAIKRYIGLSFLGYEEAILFLKKYLGEKNEDLNNW